MTGTIVGAVAIAFLGVCLVAVYCALVRSGQISRRRGE